MQKKLFSVEWPDEYGPEWLGVNFIKRCLHSPSHTNLEKDVKVTDVTIPPKEIKPATGGHDY